MEPTKSKKTLIISLAIVLFVIIALASYDLFVLSKSNNNPEFSVSIAGVYKNENSTGVTPELPSEVESGTKLIVGVAVIHDRNDTINVKISGSAAEWSYWGYYTVPQTYEMLAKSESTFSEAVNGGTIIISVPQDTEAGTYQLTITGTNNVGKTSSDIYTFAVT